MHRHIKNEAGVALIIAVVSLFIIGGLVTAAFAPTVMEQRIAENTMSGGQSFSVAEFGLNEAIGNWNTADWNSLAVWDSVTFSGSVPSGSGSYAGTVRRLNNDLYMVDVIGGDGGGTARQRVAQFVKLQLLDIDIQAALTTQGPTRVGGSAEISGTDTPPGGWGACGPTSNQAGLRLQDTNDLTTTGANCADNACIEGTPQVEADSTISDDTFFDYGDMGWTELTSMATIVIPPATYKIMPSETGGVCNTGDITNWGDPEVPSSPCFHHFPIIYAPGDLTINQDVGQGILLVEGDLNVQGGFSFYGITIVKGRLKTTGTGGHFNGAVMAANVDLDDITVFGDALVQFSSCAVQKALTQASPGAPLRSRGWLYAF
jgi:hypothetical protein